MPGASIARRFSLQFLPPHALVIGYYEGRPMRATPCSTLSEMDILKMLSELRAEREHVEEAILALERIARGRGKRRGRPPKWMTGMKRRGRPPGGKNRPK